MKRELDRILINDWFEKHTEELIDDLRTLISIKSVRGEPQKDMPYGEGPAQALAKATEMLEGKGFQVKNLENRVITADLNEKEPELGILVHVDTVPEGDGWASDPFTLRISDGNLYGRGTIDNKGPAVAAIYAMWAAREIALELNRGFRLILGSAEETGCEDIRFYLGVEKTPPNVFTPDADYPLINVEKGRYVPIFGAQWEEEYTLPRIVSIVGGSTANVVPNRAEAKIEGMDKNQIMAVCDEFRGKTGAEFFVGQHGDQVIITANGVAAHAMHPETGCNAQTALLLLLTALPIAESKGFSYIKVLNRLFPHGDTSGKALGVALDDALSGPLTLNFGVLQFGLTGFIGNFDSRTPTCATEENLYQVAETTLLQEGIKIQEMNSKTPHHHTRADSPFVQTLLQIYESYTGQKGACLSSGGTTYAHDIEGGVAFGCTMPGMDNRMHGANEFIGQGDLIVSAKMFTQAILDICSF